MKSNSYIILVSLIVISLLSVNITVAYDQFKTEDASTWPEDSESLKQLNAEQKQVTWEKASDFVKQYTINQIAGDIRKKEIDSRTQSSAILGIFGYTGPSIPPEISLKGFESSDIKWSDGLKIGNGKAWVDLENIPLTVVEVEYKDGMFSYKVKDGGTVSLEQGSLDSQGKISGIEGYEKLVLSPGREDRIEIKSGNGFKTGVFFGKDSKIKLGDKIFEAPEGKTSFFSIKEDNYIIAKGMIISSPEARITIPEKGLNSDYTDVILKESGFAGEQSVQFYRKMTQEGKSTELSLILKGKDITVDFSASKTGDFNMIKGYGENLNVKIKEGLDIKFDKEKTLVNRNPDVEKIDEKYYIYNGNAEKHEIIFGGASDVKGKAIQASILPSEFVKVCIGKYCTIGHWNAPPEEKPFGTETDRLNPLISETYVRAPKPEVDEFKELVKENHWTSSQAREEAIKFFDETESVSTVRYDSLVWKQIKPELDETIESLGLPPDLKGQVLQFQTTVFRALGGDATGEKTPIPSQTKIITTVSGKEYGIISFQMPNGRVFTHKIPGAYFDKVRQKQMRKISYTLSEIIEE